MAGAAVDGAPAEGGAGAGYSGAAAIAAAVGAAVGAAATGASAASAASAAAPVTYEYRWSIVPASWGYIMYRHDHDNLPFRQAPGSAVHKLDEALRVRGALKGAWGGALWGSNASGQGLNGVFGQCGMFTGLFLMLPFLLLHAMRAQGFQTQCQCNQFLCTPCVLDCYNVFLLRGKRALHGYGITLGFTGRLNQYKRVL